MNPENEHCKIRTEINQLEKMTYDEANKLFIDNNGYEKYPKEFTDLCEDITYKIINISVIPFSSTTRQQFIEAICIHKKTFEQAKVLFKNDKNATWYVACIVSDCNGGVFASFDIKYVDYCLRNSSK